MNLSCFLKYVHGCLSVSFRDNLYVLQSPKGPSLRKQNEDETTCELYPSGIQEASGKFSQTPQCFLSPIFSFFFAFFKLLSLFASKNSFLFMKSIMDTVKGNVLG